MIDPAQPTKEGAVVSRSSVGIVTVNTGIRAWSPDSPAEVGIIFNLSKPIEDQLENAKHFLAQHREWLREHHPDLVAKTRRPRRQKLRDYLRIIDALGPSRSIPEGQKKRYAASMYPDLASSAEGLERAIRRLDEDIPVALEYADHGYFYILDLPPDK
jgi:hypothetical protein